MTASAALAGTAADPRSGAPAAPSAAAGLSQVSVIVTCTHLSPEQRRQVRSTFPGAWLREVRGPLVSDPSPRDRAFQLGLRRQPAHIALVHDDGCGYFVGRFWRPSMAYLSCRQSRALSYGVVRLAHRLGRWHPQATVTVSGYMLRNGALTRVSHYTESPAARAERRRGWLSSIFGLHSTPAASVV